MMSDERGPPHKTTTTTGQPVTVTTTTTTASPVVTFDWIKLDVDYFKAIPGIVKLVQLFLGILCMSLGSPAVYSLGGTNFFLFVVVMAFILTLIWSIIYLLGVREALQLPVPWIQIELYYTVGATVFYLIAMIVEFASVGGWNFVGKSYYEAAAVFALFNTLVYAFGSFLLYREFKGIVTTTSTTVTA